MIRIFTFFLLLVACSPRHEVSSAISSDQAKIYGGTLDPSWNKFGAIFKTVVDDDTRYCTATPYLKDFVLVSAHCLKKNLADMSVLFFADKAAYSTLANYPAELTRQIMDVEYPDDYDSKSHMSDIAVVQLAKPAPKGTRFFELSDQVVTIAPVGVQSAWVLGYGYSGAVAVKKEGKPDLQFVGDQTYKIVGQTILPSATPGLFRLDGEHGYGTCAGDSGGPVFIVDGSHVVLIGLTAAREVPKKETDCVDNGVVVDIATMKAWILQSVEKLRARAAKSQVAAISQGK